MLNVPSLLSQQFLIPFVSLTGAQRSITHCQAQQVSRSGHRNVHLHQPLKFGVIIAPSAVLILA
jgi:hypothetical protein